ncbi:MAG: hypothetical protein H6603_01525 [Flavobacteriales bacterium]|nr:hypothetical protein [Flavobacteriales bacterium]
MKVNVAIASARSMVGNTALGFGAGLNINGAYSPTVTNNCVSIGLSVAV